LYCPAHGISLVKVKYFTSKSEVCFANENQTFLWGDKNAKLRAAGLKDEKENKSLTFNRKKFKAESSK
jgi:hypothetical protein